MRTLKNLLYIAHFLPETLYEIFVKNVFFGNCPRYLNNKIKYHSMY